MSGNRAFRDFVGVLNILKNRIWCKKPKARSRFSFKLYAFVFLCISLFSFVSCDLLENPVKPFLEGQTARVAFTGSSSFTPVGITASDGYINVPSTAECVLRLPINNERNLTFTSGDNMKVSFSESLFYGNASRDTLIESVQIEQVSKDTIQITYPAAFLAAAKNGGDITPKIWLCHPQNRNDFGTQSPVRVRCNDRPDPLTEASLYRSNTHQDSISLFFALPTQNSSKSRVTKISFNGALYNVDCNNNQLEGISASSLSSVLTNYTKCGSATTQFGGTGFSRPLGNVSSCTLRMIDEWGLESEPTVINVVNDIVYVANTTPNSGSYHIKYNCSGATTEISLQEAKTLGKKPCRTCTSKILSITAQTSSTVTVVQDPLTTTLNSAAIKNLFTSPTNLTVHYDDGEADSTNQLSAFTLQDIDTSTLGVKEIFATAGPAVGKTLDTPIKITDLKISVVGKEVSSVSVKTQPTNNLFYIGEIQEVSGTAKEITKDTILNGLVLTVTYNDSTTKDVTYNATTASCFNLVFTGNVDLTNFTNASGTVGVRVNYSEDQGANYNGAALTDLDVGKPEIMGVQIDSTQTSKTTYKTNEVLDKASTFVKIEKGRPGSGRSGNDFASLDDFETIYDLQVELSNGGTVITKAPATAQTNYNVVIKLTADSSNTDFASSTATCSSFNINVEQSILTINDNVDPIIKTPPTKNTYTVGDKGTDVDLTSLVLTLTDTDSNTVDIDYATYSSYITFATKGFVEAKNATDASGQRSALVTKDTKFIEVDISWLGSPSTTIKGKLYNDYLGVGYIPITVDIPTEYYVSSTGNDSNNGTTATTAFASMTKAISEVITDNTTNAVPYIIHVSGEITGDNATVSLTNTNVTSALDLTIQGSNKATDKLNRGLTSAASNGQVIKIGKSSAAGNVTVTVTIKNLTITGGATSDKGGGVFVNYGADVTITDCDITGNKATDGGGGLGVVGNTAKAKLVRTSITGNTCKNGAGMYVPSTQGITLEDCTITGNTFPTGASTTQGKGISLDGVPLNIKGSTKIGSATDDNDIYLGVSGSAYRVITVTGALASDAYINITPSIPSGSSAPAVGSVVVQGSSYTLTAQDIDKFHVLPESLNMGVALETTGEGVLKAHVQGGTIIINDPAGYTVNTTGLTTTIQKGTAYTVSVTAQDVQGDTVTVATPSIKVLNRGTEVQGAVSGNVITIPTSYPSETYTVVVQCSIGNGYFVFSKTLDVLVTD